jgi:WD40 repeat protein
MLALVGFCVACAGGCGQQGAAVPVVVDAAATAPVDCLAFSPDGQMLAANFNDVIKVWDAASGEERLKLTAPSAVNALAWSPDGKFLAAGCLMKTVEIWDVSGHPLHSLSGFKAPPTALAWSPDGRVLAAAAGDPNPYADQRGHVRSEVRLWDPAAGKQIAELTNPGDTALSLAFSPDSATLAAGCHDGRVRVWDVSGRNERAPALAHGRQPVSSVAFRADGSLLAAVGFDGQISLWDAAGWKEKGRLPGEGTRVNSVAFAGSDKLLITGAEDGSVRLWDPAERVENAVLVPRGPRVHVVAAQARGNAIACGGAGRIVYVWDLPAGEPAPGLKPRLSLQY